MFLILFSTASLGVEKQLISIKVDAPPVIDGDSSDPAWKNAPVLTTHDPVAGIDLLIQSVYSRDKIYMLARYQDQTENRQHKELVWNVEKQQYEIGPTREDAFVFKWNMLPIAADITISANLPYKADVWYWKSSRTDPIGYADDKIQTYQTLKSKNSKLLISKDGQFFYLTRKGDQGDSAYKFNIHMDKTETQVPMYSNRIPTGSRADISAKGQWNNGVWTIEFERALQTGHKDDLQFNPEKNYYFGVSRYEIAGRKPDPQLQEPYFGSGEITELIQLRFEK